MGDRAARRRDVADEPDGRFDNPARPRPGVHDGDRRHQPSTILTAGVVLVLRRRGRSVQSSRLVPGHAGCLASGASCEDHRPRSCARTADERAPSGRNRWSQRQPRADTAASRRTERGLQPRAAPSHSAEYRRNRSDACELSDGIRWRDQVQPQQSPERRYIPPCSNAKVAVSSLQAGH
jgi:hypothetical protein